MAAEERCKFVLLYYFFGVPEADGDRMDQFLVFSTTMASLAVDGDRMANFWSSLPPWPLLL